MDIAAGKPPGNKGVNQPSSVWISLLFDAYNLNIKLNKTPANT